MARSLHCTEPKSVSRPTRVLDQGGVEPRLAVSVRPEGHRQYYCTTAPAISDIRRQVRKLTCQWNSKLHDAKIEKFQCQASSVANRSWSSCWACALTESASGSWPSHWDPHCGSRGSIRLKRLHQISRSCSTPPGFECALHSPFELVSSGRFTMGWLPSESLSASCLASTQWDMGHGRALSSKYSNALKPHPVCMCPCHETLHVNIKRLHVNFNIKNSSLDLSLRNAYHYHACLGFSPWLYLHEP